MKKTLLIFIVIFLAGCGKITPELEIYNEYINKLELEERSTTSIVDINLYLERLNDEEIIYRIVIDNNTEDMYNISAIVMHNLETSDIFPSIGIFDEKVNLTSESDTKGIILTGYIKYREDISRFKGKIKVLIKYNEEKEIYFIYGGQE